MVAPAVLAGRAKAVKAAPHPVAAAAAAATAGAVAAGEPARAARRRGAFRVAQVRRPGRAPLELRAGALRGSSLRISHHRSGIVKCNSGKVVSVTGQEGLDPLTTCHQVGSTSEYLSQAPHLVTLKSSLNCLSFSGFYDTNQVVKTFGGCGRHTACSCNFCCAKF